MGEVNQLTAQIAQLNVQVVRAETSGQQAADLRDARDLAVDRLSTLLDVSVQENADGAVNVYNGGRILVQVDQSVALTMTTRSESGALKTDVCYGRSGTPLHLQSGELKSLMELRDQDVGALMSDLDSFAVTLAERVNEVHRVGYGLTGTDGMEFFSADVTGASTLRLSQLVTDDPDRIATASAPGAPGDNSIALQIAGIQSEKLLRNGRSTLDEFYRDSVLQLASRKSYAESQLEVEEAAMENLENRRQQASGVSMDEEMTRLVQIQQAYEAAAKIISTVDEMMATVLTTGAA